jgi:hypothetical protein
MVGYEKTLNIQKLRGVFFGYVRDLLASHQGEYRGL